MDNLTHSIVGLGVGELLHRSLPAETDTLAQRTRHRLLLLSCAVASNAPDLDLFLTRLLPDPLGYLLHHRGHTHTVLFALVQALLLLGAILLLWPSARALLKRSGNARTGLAAALLMGLGLHLLMDYLNSYGLHPFYPFDRHWFYGDMVFIIEPLFWVAFGVPMALLLRPVAARALVLAGLVAALCFFSARGFLDWGSLITLLAIGVATGALQWRAGPYGRKALLLAGAVCLAFIGLQGGASALGKARIASALQQRDADTRVLDVAMTAYPSHPLCWVFVSVESRESADSYTLRRGVLSLAPGWLPPRACPAGLATGPGVALTPAIEVSAETSGSLAALRTLKSDNCYVDAWLRFARAPALRDGALGDFRFAATPGGNFTRLELAGTAGRTCPSPVPQWDYPRQDLLLPSAALPVPGE